VQLTYVFVEPDHMVLYMHDLGTPHSAEMAGRESEARYRSLVASLPDAVLLSNADGSVLACNDAAARLFGWSTQADLLGLQQVLAPGYRVLTEAGEPVAPHELPSHRVLATGTAEPGHVFALVTPSHGVRWLRIAAQPIHASGRVSGSVSIFTDITDRVEAQRGLRESAARLDLALSAARMGVWEYEPDSDKGWWSPNLNDIFQIGPIAGRASYMTHVHQDDRDAVTSQTEALRAGKHGDTFEQEYRIIGGDMVTRWARVRGRISPGGGRLSLAGTVMDVTERHKLEEELRRAHRLESIGRLAGGVAHDFNNLLAAMLGSLELVEQHCPSVASADLATVRHGALRARDLTRQLLAFARKQPLAFQVVELSLLVTTVQRLLKRLVGPDVEMVIQDNARVSVRADPALLEQVLVNLVVNARDAMPSGGRLVVRVDRETSAAPGGAGKGDFALLEVSDSGVGMDEETRRHVFDPFFTTKSHGTGLGLASSYGIVAQHGGEIVVESEPGRGTRFRVLLPAVPDASADAVTSAAPAALPAPESAKSMVLVVDDEDLVRSTAVRTLQSLGYDVLAAADASEALLRSNEHQGPIDVLLCDIAMPGRGGPSIAAELRGLRPELKVLFVSGYLQGAEDTLAPGTGYLQKPYRRAALVAKLEELRRS